MRGFGFFLSVVGVIAIIAALMMDTSVGTLGGGRVNNLGLMADRQLYTLLGGIVLVVGVLMVLFTGRSLAGVAATQAESDTRPCPHCAEPIKHAAVKCKHCGSDVEAAEIELPSRGWTIRLTCKNASELGKVKDQIAIIGYPLLPPDGTTLIIGYFEDHDEAKAAHKNLGRKYALHGSLYYPKQV